MNRPAIKEMEQDVSVVDLSGDVCPMTFYKMNTKLKQLSEGERVIFILQGQEQIKKLPVCIRHDGSRIERAERDGQRLVLHVVKG